MCRCSPPRAVAKRSALTLVELLVVVAIVALLMSLLFSGVQAARESARRLQCGSNLKQLAVAAEAHKSRSGYFPTGGWDETWTAVAGQGSDWRQPGGWCYAVLPFLELQAAYDSVNTAVAVPAFACPSRRGSSLGPGSIGVMTDYAGNRGAWASAPASLAGTTANRTTTFGANVVSGLPASPSAFTGDNWLTVSQTLNTSQPILYAGTTVTVPTGGVIFAGSALPPAAIRDSTSQTYLCAEKYVPRAQYGTGAWSGYDKSAYVGDSPNTLRGGHRPPENDATAFTAGMEGAFGGPHVGLFMAVMCDTSVRTLDLSIDPGVHFLLSCRADRTNASPPD